MRRSIIYTCTHTLLVYIIYYDNNNNQHLKYIYIPGNMSLTFFRIIDLKVYLYLKMRLLYLI